jgi:hypothetical protein
MGEISALQKSYIYRNIYIYISVEQANCKSDYLNIKYVKICEL